MPDDFEEEFHVSISDFDMDLPSVLEDVADLKIPFRIYSGVFHDGYEKDESIVAIEIDAIIKAAIWGAENADWVKAFMQRRQARRDAEDGFEYDLGPMQ